MIIGSRQRLKNLDHVPKISINGHQIERVYKWIFDCFKHIVTEII